MTKRNLNILFAFSLVILLYSCEEDTFDDFSDPRDVFIGTWDVSESCYKDAYSVEIVKDPLNSAQVLVNNFWNWGYNEKPPAALVVGQKIYFNNAGFTDDELVVDGEGALDKNKITWQYQVFDGADITECEASYTLQ